MIKDIDYVICPICKKPFLYLRHHITQTHKLSFDNFKKLYPRVKIMSKKTYEKFSEANSGENNPSYGRYFIRSKETVERLSKGVRLWISKNPELVHKQAVARGKKSYKLHPENIKNLEKGWKGNTWWHGLDYLNKNSPFRYMGIG